MSTLTTPTHAVTIRPEIARLVKIEHDALGNPTVHTSCNAFTSDPAGMHRAVEIAMRDAIDRATRDLTRHLADREQRTDETHYQARERMAAYLHETRPILRSVTVDTSMSSIGSVWTLIATVQVSVSEGVSA